MKRWGFTPQRPLKKAYEQSPEAVAKWMNEEYPKIAVQAKQEGAESQSADGTGLRSDDVRGRGYAPEGKTPVVLANSNRSELNPDEMLNADLKQHVTKAAPARNKIAQTRTAIGALRSIQK